MGPPIQAHLSTPSGRQRGTELQAGEIGRGKDGPTYPLLLADSEAQSSRLEKLAEVKIGPPVRPPGRQRGTELQAGEIGRGKDGPTYPPLLADSEVQNFRLEKLAEVRWAYLSALLADSEAQNSRLEKLAEVRWATCPTSWQTTRHRTPGWRNWQR
jgi:ribosomal protein L27